MTAPVSPIRFMAQLVLSVKIAPAEEELRDVMRFAKLHALGVFFVVVSADIIVKLASIGCVVRIVKSGFQAARSAGKHPEDFHRPVTGIKLSHLQ